MGICSFLTPWAVMSTATRAAGFFDGVAAAGARLALLAKDLEIVRKISSIATGVDKVLEGGTTDFD